VLRVDKIDVRHVVNDSTVDLLRHSIIKASIPSFQVEYWNSPSFSCNCAETRVRVSEDKHRVRSLGLEDFVEPLDDERYCLGGGCPSSFKKMIGPTNSQVPKKYFVQLEIEILPRVN
jgi:hypothetical protein